MKVEIVLFETVAIQISTRIRIRVNIILLHGGNPGPRKEKDKTTWKRNPRKCLDFFPRMAGHDRPGDRPNSNLHAWAGGSKLGWKASSIFSSLVSLCIIPGTIAQPRPRRTNFTSSVLLLVPLADVKLIYCWSFWPERRGVGMVRIRYLVGFGLSSWFSLRSHQICLRQIRKCHIWGRQRFQHGWSQLSSPFFYSLPFRICFGHVSKRWLNSQSEFPTGH